VVVKCVRRDDPNGEAFAAKQFRRGFNGAADPEIDSTKTLDHPRVTRVVDIFRGDNASSTVMVMGLIPGKDLRREAERIKADLNGKMFPKEILFDWLSQCSELLAYCNSKKVIHRDPHLGNWMIDPEGKIYLMDFGTGLYLENDIVTEGHDKETHGPWGFGPEGYTGVDYTYNADVPYYGKEFAWLASINTGEGRDLCPYQALFGEDKDCFEGGIKRAYPRFKELTKDGGYKLTFRGANRYGPEFEKLIASMHAHDPKDRPSNADVALACKSLK
jgi:serine/threonine protein kinase